MTPSPTIRCVATAFLFTALPAQQLARDVNQAPYVGDLGSSSQQFASSDGQRAFFDGWSQDGGIEPWITDGTAAGTRLVRDLFPGAASSGPEPILWVGNRLLLATRTGTQRGRLWASDGTAAGTVPVSDLPTTLGSFRGLGVLSGRAIFGGAGLWASDLTSAGTVALAGCTVYGGYVHGASVGNRIVFTANGDAAGFEPWVTDGTPAGTLRLADIHPIASMPDRYTAFGNHVYFFATGPLGTAELWRTDGTPAGTQLVVATPYPRTTTSGERLVRAGGALLALVGGGLWRSDGTAAGSSLLMPAGASTVRELLSDGTTAFAVYGSQLWRCDGTPGGLQFVADLGATLAPPRGLHFRSFVHQGELRLASMSYTLGLTTVVASDGTAAGTTTADVVGTNGPVVLRIDRRMLLLARMVGTSGPVFVAISDGTPAGTSTIWATTGRTGNTPQKSVANGGVLYTFLNDGVHGLELWRSDGTAAGTTMVVDLVPGPDASIGGYSELVALDGFVYFTATSPATGQALWRSDGTAAGTTLVYDSLGAANGAPRSLQVDGHELYFSDVDPAGLMLTVMRSDGTPQGTAPVPFVPVSWHYPFGVAGGVVVCMGPNGSFWRTDGTANGAYALPGPPLAAGARLRDRIVYFGYITGSPLWVTDGTVAGTQQLLASVAGQATAASLRPWKNGLGRLAGTELIFTDGTVGGTTRTLLPLPGDALSSAFAGDQVYAVVEDGPHGRELWRSDGTAAGTVRVTDLAPGFQHGVAAVFGTPLGDRVLLAASNGQDGLEPYLSDGTAAGTVRIADLAPAGSSNPQFLGVAGDRLYYLADDGVTGMEPGSMPLAVVGNPALESFGVGCPGAAGLPELAASAPRLGAAIAYELRHARAFAPCLFGFSVGLATTVLPGGCVVHLAGNALASLTAANGLGEAGQNVALPNDPALLGLAIMAQALVVDPLGSALPGIAASQGVLAIAGR